MTDASTVSAILHDDIQVLRAEQRQDAASVKRHFDAGEHRFDVIDHAINELKGELRALRATRSGPRATGHAPRAAHHRWGLNAVGNWTTRDWMLAGGAGLLLKLSGIQVAELLGVI